MDAFNLTIKTKLITEVNAHVALFRDLLIHIGQSKDCPELRERIRKLRRQCVDALRNTSQQLLPQIKSWEGAKGRKW
ncbi:hypothetical protein J437_LFUL003822 [Ladona fulva]|uniref:Syntaxin N-terminal domain-containing protein n=1 Tax=Ladona fulva TaxID=123851 RepID=A0A8K0P5F0_LADFU|nr:hypothetical protein J437_LFUL003822 [Ladona fulva]